MLRFGTICTHVLLVVLCFVLLLHAQDAEIEPSPVANTSCDQLAVAELRVHNPAVAAGVRAFGMVSSWMAADAAEGDGGEALLNCTRRLEVAAAAGQAAGRVVRVVLSASAEEPGSGHIHITHHRDCVLDPARGRYVAVDVAVDVSQQANTTVILSGWRATLAELRIVASPASTAASSVDQRASSNTVVVSLLHSTLEVDSALLMSTDTLPVGEVDIDVVHVFAVAFPATAGGEADMLGAFAGSRQVAVELMVLNSTIVVTRGGEPLRTFAVASAVVNASSSSVESIAATTVIQDTSITVTAVPPSTNVIVASWVVVGNGEPSSSRDGNSTASAFLISVERSTVDVRQPGTVTGWASYPCVAIASVANCGQIKGVTTRSLQAWSLGLSRVAIVVDRSNLTHIDTTVHQVTTLTTIVASMNALDSLGRFVFLQYNESSPALTVTIDGSFVSIVRHGGEVMVGSLRATAATVEWVADPTATVAFASSSPLGMVGLAVIDSAVRISSGSATVVAVASLVADMGASVSITRNLSSTTAPNTAHRVLLATANSTCTVDIDGPFETAVRVIAVAAVVAESNGGVQIIANDAEEATTSSGGVAGRILETRLSALQSNVSINVVHSVVEAPCVAGLCLHHGGKMQLDGAAVQLLSTTVENCNITLNVGENVNGAAVAGIALRLVSNVSAASGTVWRSLVQRSHVSLVASTSNAMVVAGLGSKSSWWVLANVSVSIHDSVVTVASGSTGQGLAVGGIASRSGVPGTLSRVAGPWVALVTNSTIVVRGAVAAIAGGVSEGLPTSVAAFYAVSQGSQLALTTTPGGFPTDPAAVLSIAGTMNLSTSPVAQQQQQATDVVSEGQFASCASSLRRAGAGNVVVNGSGARASTDTSASTSFAQCCKAAAVDCLPATVRLLQDHCAAERLATPAPTAWRTKSTTLLATPTVMSSSSATLQATRTILPPSDVTDTPPQPPPAVVRSTRTLSLPASNHDTTPSASPTKTGTNAAFVDAGTSWGLRSPTLQTAADASVAVAVVAALSLGPGGGASRPARVGAVLNLRRCVSDELEPPSHLELPLQANALSHDDDDRNGGVARAVALITLGHAVLVLVLAAGSVVLLRGGQRSAAIVGMCEALVSVPVSYFGPTIAEISASWAPAGSLGLFAVAAFLILFLWIALLAAAASSSQEMGGVSNGASVDDARGGLWGSLVRSAAPLCSGTRDDTRVSIRLYFFVETGAAVAFAAVCGIQQADLCSQRAWVAVVIAGCFLVYLVWLRPPPTRLDLGFAVLFAVAQLAAGVFAAGAIEYQPTGGGESGGMGDTLADLSDAAALVGLLLVFVQAVVMLTMALLRRSSSSSPNSSPSLVSCDDHDGQRDTTTTAAPLLRVPEVPPAASSGAARRPTRTVKDDTVPAGHANPLRELQTR